MADMAIWWGNGDVDVRDRSEHGMDGKLVP